MSDTKAMNGLTGSSTQQNGSVRSSSRKRKGSSRNRRSWFLGILDWSLRLALWGIVFTIFFTCPSTTDLTSQSPRLCKTYGALKNRISPYVTPNYNTYLKPYVDQFQPHVQNVYRPATEFVVENYNVYAAPKVEKAQDYLFQKWSDNVQPQIDIGKNVAVKKYQQNLAPGIIDTIEVIRPFAQKAQTSSQQVYNGYLIPVYDKSFPHVQKFYNQGHYVTTHIILPYTQQIHATITDFLSRHVWPQLIILYGENVEPQITRITERLARYKDSKRLKAVVEAEVLSESMSSIFSSITPEPRADSDVISNDESISTVIESGSEPISPEVDVREQIEMDLKKWQNKFSLAAEKGAEDLEERVKVITSHQIKAQAHGVGNTLVIQLGNTIQSSLKDLKSHINTSISKLPIESSAVEEDEVYDDLVQYIRSAGDKIRHKAIAVRSWKQAYENETDNLIQAALESTLEVIDNIRELGLQQMGMRWAWMEGVTYKDWSKYHDLKKAFDSYRDVVSDTIRNHEGVTKAQKEGENIINKATQMAEDVANELKRLKDVARWKVLARDTTDNFMTKTIPPRAVKAAESIASKASENVRDILSSASSLVIASPTKDSTEIVKEKVEKVATNVQSVISAVSEKLSSAADKSTPSEATESTESTEISSSIKTADSTQSDESVDSNEVLKETSLPSPKVWGGVSAGFMEGNQVNVSEDDESWSEKIESLLDAAGERVADLTNAVSEALIPPTKTKNAYESATSIASEQYFAALSAAANALYGNPVPVYEKAAKDVNDRYGEAVTAASYAIYGSPTPIVASAASQIEEALASITSLASAQLRNQISQASIYFTEAKIAIGVQPKPLQRQFNDEARRIYREAVVVAQEQSIYFVSVASSAVYGTPTPWHENLINDASEKVYATAAPVYESLVSKAKEQYDEIIAQASQKLNLVKFSAGEVAASTEDIGVERLLARASSLFNDASMRASAGFDLATSSASSLVYGTSTPWTESVASQAIINYDALITKASEQIYGTPTPLIESAWMKAKDYASLASAIGVSQIEVVHDKVSELVDLVPEIADNIASQVDSAYNSGIPQAFDSAASLATQAYDSASSVLGSVFTPPANLENLLDSANKQFQSAVDAASVQIYGTSQGPIENARSAVADGYNSAASIASEAIYGKQPGYLEAAQINLALAASSAQQAVSEAIYGTPTGYFEAATSSVGDIYGSATEIAGDQYSSMSAKASEIMYGPELGAWESASSRIAAAAESANSAIESLWADASVSVENAVSVVGTKISEVTDRVKDEL